MKEQTIYVNVTHRRELEAGDIVRLKGDTMEMVVEQTDDLPEDEPRAMHVNPEDGGGYATVYYRDDIKQLQRTTLHVSTIQVKRNIAHAITTATMNLVAHLDHWHKERSTTRQGGREQYYKGYDDMFKRMIEEIKGIHSQDLLTEFSILNTIKQP